MAHDGRVSFTTTRSSGDADDRDDASRRDDRISDLSDNILHQILVLIPFLEAVRTCVLSRRWRGVWTRLPLLILHAGEDAPPPRVRRFADHMDGVLRGYSDANVDVDNLFVWVDSDTVITNPVRLAAAAAHLAARRVTGRLAIFLSPTSADMYHMAGDGEAVLLQLPCLPRVTHFSLTFIGVHLEMPMAGTFASLTSMYLAGVRFTDDGEGISDVVSSRCPRIKILDLLTVRGLRTLTVVSRSLVSLRLCGVMELERLRVVAAELGEMVVDTCFVLNGGAGAAMLLVAPALEKLRWEDRCPRELGGPWKLPGCLLKLVVTEVVLPERLDNGARGQSNFTRILDLFQRVHILRLHVPIARDHANQKSLIENLNIPYCPELEFIASHTKHKFGPTIIRLLKRNICVRKLSIQMSPKEQARYIPCASDCNCRQVTIWRDKGVNLIPLEWVIMYEFSGSHDENSFIYYIILRNAKALRRVSIVFSAGVEPTRRFLRKLHKLSAPGCAVEY
ncbi:hypothetical protein HU200_054577 [Digitaria exilis]|uniref:F-box domain-containing protein n=1 Tax=Digitaria exilis TaxID=1010633 RepID=A0A835AH43_9POAL|nr:hypothetical protein HU200_054577 [Digitaria exilis]